MALLRPPERSLIEAISQLTHANPFLPERISIERRILGREHQPAKGSAWSLELDAPQSPNLARIQRKMEVLAESIRQRLLDGIRGDAIEYELYDDLVMHLLYFRLDEVRKQAADVEVFRRKSTVKQFVEGVQYFLHSAEIDFPSRRTLAHSYAMIYQIQRAFHNIFDSVVGRSKAAIRLRAAIWQSIFSCDMRRYRRSMHQHMSKIATLVAGPSGTGKELVASAIGRSQYCAFDETKGSFATGGGEDYHALHLAALPVTLVESELFGHAKGSFTGANRDRVGWLEAVGPFGAVFLDEIGEIDLQIQVKLLRVLQTRQFQRIGEQDPRTFSGKLIAATNRDLRREIALKSFREDLYFRLCGDLIVTPSLRDQLSDAPEDLRQFVRFIALQSLPDEPESIVSDVMNWIDRNLPASYPWPGNFRELEQCVRNVIVHAAYDFSANSQTGATGWLGSTASQMDLLTVSADELLRRYCTFAYWKAGSFGSAADALRLDRRTLRAKIDEQFLRQLKSK